MPVKLADFVEKEKRGRPRPVKTGSPRRAPPDGNASLGRTQRPAFARRAWKALRWKARKTWGIANQFLWLGLRELRSEMWRTRSPRRFLRIGRRIAARMLARLFGSDYRYARLASECTIAITWGGPRTRKRVARKLVAAAATRPQRAVACNLLETVEAGDLKRAARIMANARMYFGRGEGMYKRKIVSRKYGFFWLSNPKVATRSIIYSLHSVDPEAEVFDYYSVNDILLMRPEVRDYFSFAFVRNPFHRSVSLYSHMFLRESDLNWDYWQKSYRGLSTEMDFESFCAWLASPYGADEFSDPHWLSQHLHLEMPPDGYRGVDFVGRLETAADDFRTVARRIGLPDLHLLHRNTIVGKMPKNRKDVETVQRATQAAHLTDRARELIRRRYADDFRIFGYDPE